MKEKKKEEKRKRKTEGYYWQSKNLGKPIFALIVTKTFCSLPKLNQSVVERALTHFRSLL